MQLLIGDPPATRSLHATCDAALGLALVDRRDRPRARACRVAADDGALVACTALFGLGVPAVVFLLAGTLGGVPQNASATLAFLFPLAMSAALFVATRAPADAILARPSATLRAPARSL